MGVGVQVPPPTLNHRWSTTAGDPNRASVVTEWSQEFAVTFRRHVPKMRPATIIASSPLHRGCRFLSRRCAAASDGFSLPAHDDRVGAEFDITNRSQRSAFAHPRRIRLSTWTALASAEARVARADCAAGEGPLKALAASRMSLVVASGCEIIGTCDGRTSTVVAPTAHHPVPPPLSPLSRLFGWVVAGTGALDLVDPPAETQC